MRTLEDALDQIAYHPATPEVSEKYAAMRAEVAALVKNTWNLIPEGPEKTLAMRGLQQFLMMGNLAIALTTPADYATPNVARVLPDGAQMEGFLYASKDPLPNGATWRCARCATPLNNNATRNHLPPQYRYADPVCDACAMDLGAPRATGG